MPLNYRGHRLPKTLCFLLVVFLSLAVPAAQAQSILEQPEALSVLRQLELTPDDVKHAGFEAAIQALVEGDYSKAYDQVWPQAEQGNPVAWQIALFAARAQSKKQVEEIRKQEEKEKRQWLASTGPVDLRDYDERYRFSRPGPDQEQFAQAERHLKAGDYSAAFQEFEMLANAGDPEAEYIVSVFYRLGLGVKPSSYLADSYFGSSVDQGLPLARSEDNIRRSYYRFPSNSSEFDEYYWAMVSASNGAVGGYAWLSEFYCRGLGFYKNPVLADTWLVLASRSKEDFFENMCAENIDFPSSYYEAVRERAEAMSKAYDIPLYGHRAQHAQP
ncbi:hypothetical protein AAFN88_12835 [Pelagibius sp. CAU 1746]|uniref:hypothetical protein n=1 Tax=Pelagibius sp. CAU 1746 TaxID=3140370 RepID=UPI00325BAF08